MQLAASTLDPGQLHAPVFLLRGEDEVLLADTAVELVHALVGDGDRSLLVEELDGERYERDGEAHLGPLVDAAQTPPFLTDRRIVVGRQLGSFGSADAVAPLVEYLGTPLDTTSLVLVWERSAKAGAQMKAPPKKLLDAVKAAGGVILVTDPGSGKDRTAWLTEHLRHAPVKLDAAAQKVVLDRIGEDAGLLVGLLPTLASVYGEGARLTADDVWPYLGVEGSVRPFDLTDAIDRGDVADALDKLHRLLDGGGWHPLQVMATLHNHYGRMLALDGSGAADERAAAELLGMKGSTFPARKALDQSRRLGPERLAEFVGLLAQADLDLRGAKAWPPELVVEVLVARLAGRTPAGRRGAGAARARR